MKIRLPAPIAVAVLLSPCVVQSLSAQETGDMCVECHQNLDSQSPDNPVVLFQDDLHADAGFGCVDCHGGDASIAGLGGMDPQLGFLGVPVGEEVITVCGRCHSDAEFMRQYDPSLRVDQVTEYWSSRHGQRLAAAGDTAVATCEDCHAPHGIRSASDPNSAVHPIRVAATCGRCHDDPDRMSPYGIATDQREKYERSVHHAAMVDGGDLSAPTCNDCHGNHGAAPPGLSWVGNVCGHCHATIAEQYESSRHSQTFTSLGMPGCATCHRNHEILAAADSLLGLDDGAICANCHAEGDPGGTAAIAMRSELDSLIAGIELATDILDEAEQAGMEVSEAQADLSTAHSALVMGRTVVHSFSPEAVSEAVAPGLEVASAGYLRGIEALDDLRIRRIGLVISVVIILAFVLGLALKIRQIEA